MRFSALECWGYFEGFRLPTATRFPSTSFVYRSSQAYFRQQTPPRVLRAIKTIKTVSGSSYKARSYQRQGNVVAPARVAKSKVADQNGKAQAVDSPPPRVLKRGRLTTKPTRSRLLFQTLAKSCACASTEPLASTSH